MILIADSGATKTDWCICHSENDYDIVKTQGINPFFQSYDEIIGILSSELLPLLGKSVVLSAIYFYGSGCRVEKIPFLKDALRTVFPNVDIVEINNDLLGAARALCGNNDGIACILGTGANSCYYNGAEIVMNTPPLGFILGDEGSGAVLGRNFVNAVFKGKLPQSICDDFLAKSNLTISEIVERVYRQPLPNRFLASLSEYIYEYIDDIDVHNIIVNNFRLFIINNVKLYGHSNLPINVIGSIAFHYKSFFVEAAAKENYSVGKIEKSPMRGLVEYHTKNV